MHVEFAYSRTIRVERIRVMLFLRGNRMSINIPSASPGDPVASDIRRPQPNWSERIVMGVATSTAVLIVAIIAVLMGMT